MEKFIYKVGKNFNLIERIIYDLQIGKYKKEGYNEVEAQIKALNNLAESYDFSFWEV